MSSLGRQEPIGDFPGWCRSLAQGFNISCSTTDSGWSLVASSEDPLGGWAIGLGQLSEQAAVRSVVLVDVVCLRHASVSSGLSFSNPAGICSMGKNTRGSTSGGSPKVEDAFLANI